MLNGGYDYRERLGPSASGCTVLDYLAERYRHSSSPVWKEHIEAGRVLVDGVRAHASRTLSPGEVLVWRRPPWVEPPAPSSFAVLHADDHVLAVAKPRGLAAMPGGGFLDRSLLRLMRRYDPAASPLHRLGRGTSGITLFARDARSRRYLTDAWQRGAVERRYIALVAGRFPWEQVTIDEPIGRAPHPLLGSVAAVHPDGKASATRVGLIEHRSETSLVDVHIETGRTHQIRIHLAALGYPLLGDPLYPKGGVPEPSTTALPGDLGYLLHAQRVRFPHPAGGKLVTIECAPPAELRPGMP